MISLLSEDSITHLTNNFPGSLNIIDCYPISGGCINRACKLKTNQGNFFIKWNTSGPKDMFLREAESLTEMRKSVNEYIVVPEPLLAKTIDNTPGYLLTSFLESGKVGNDDELLGRGLAILHKMTANKFGFISNNYCGSTLQNNNQQSDWFIFYSQNRIGHLVTLISKYRSWSSSDYLLTEKFLRKIESLLSHKPQPSLIHGDLWSGNYMFTSQGPAIIDPASSYCDREFELGIMTMFGGFSPRVYDAYNEVFPLPSEWRVRNPIYQLYHVLNH